MAGIGTRLHFIGTVHVDPASAAIVRESIQRVRPEVVALELDEARLSTLQNPRRARMTGSAGFSFLAMVLLEKFAGQLTGSPPGMEMFEAAKAARTVGARIELVDLPISTTIAALRQLPLREKARLALDSAGSILFFPFGRTELASLGERVGEQLPLFRKRYPYLSRLLLDTREEYMVNRLKSILDSTTGQIVVVVGSGHVASLKKRLENYEGKPVFSTSYSWSVSTVAPGSE